MLASLESQHGNSSASSQPDEGAVTHIMMSDSDSEAKERNFCKTELVVLSVADVTLHVHMFINYAKRGEVPVLYHLIPLIFKALTPAEELNEVKSGSVVVDLL